MPKPLPPAKKRSKLIRAREYLGMTRPQLAKKLGASRQNIYRIEIGVAHPSLALMQRWAKALPGVSMEFFRGTAPKARPSKRASARTPSSDAAE
jgi:DNA-binding XRE family transcriptional regulator